MKKYWKKKAIVALFNHGWSMEMLSKAFEVSLKYIENSIRIGIR